MARSKVTKRRRGKRAGPTRRIGITFNAAAFDMLSEQSKATGYTIAAVARLTMDRALALGLLHSSTPPSKAEDLVKLYQKETLEQVHEELRLAMQENIDLLLKRIDIYERRDDQKQQMLDESAEIITDQARDIQFYEQGRVHDAADADLPDDQADD